MQVGALTYPDATERPAAETRFRDIAIAGEMERAKGFEPSTPTLQGVLYPDYAALASRTPVGGRLEAPITAGPGFAAQTGLAAPFTSAGRAHMGPAFRNSKDRHVAILGLNLDEQKRRPLPKDSSSHR